MISEILKMGRRRIPASILLAILLAGCGEDTKSTDTRASGRSGIPPTSTTFLDSRGVIVSTPDQSSNSVVDTGQLTALLSQLKIKVSDLLGVTGRAAAIEKNIERAIDLFIESDGLDSSSPKYIGASRFLLGFLKSIAASSGTDLGIPPDQIKILLRTPSALMFPNEFVAILISTFGLVPPPPPPGGSFPVYVTDSFLNRVQMFTREGEFVLSWGAPGSGNGQFDLPTGIAVGPDKSVYVTERGENQRVQRFSSTGEFITKWGSPGSGDGQFFNPSSIAVAPNGAVYVADFNNNRIQKFTSAGVFVAAFPAVLPFGVTVDSVGDVYITEWAVAELVGRVRKLSPTGAELLSFTSPAGGDVFHRPTGISVGPDGSIYIVNLGEFNEVPDIGVHKFSSIGAFLLKWGSGVPGSEIQFARPKGVSVNPSDSRVYVSDESGFPSRIQAFSNTGTFLFKWGPVGFGEGQFIAAESLAIGQP